VGVKGDKKKEEDQPGDEGSKCWAFVVRQHVELAVTQEERRRDKKREYDQQIG